MKRVNWIIEKYIFDQYEDKLVHAIKTSGMNVIVYDDTEDRFSDFTEYVNKKFTQDDIVMMHGSLQLGRRMLKASAYPGIFLTLDNYECYNYYGYYGAPLLNSKYMMMGLNDVLRNEDNIFEVFGTDKVFIRPSNGYKTFTGQVLSKDNFKEEFDTLTKSYGGLDMNTLVLFAPPQDIDEEWRFIVVDGVVVSGSLYMDSKNRPTWEAYYDKPCENPMAYSFARICAEIYQPDKAFTIDVCRLKDGSFKMIEINSLCCASWYGNDFNKVINAMNRLCIKEYEDVYDPYE